MVVGTIILITAYAILMATVYLWYRFEGENRSTMLPSEKEHLISATKLALKNQGFSVSEDQATDNRAADPNDIFIAPWWYPLAYMLSVLLPLLFIIGSVVLLAMYHKAMNALVYELLYGLPLPDTIFFPSVYILMISNLLIVVALGLLVAMVSIKIIETFVKTPILDAWCNLARRVAMRSRRAKGLRKYFSRAEIQQEIAKMKNHSYHKTTLFLILALFIFSAPFSILAFDNYKIFDANGITENKFLSFSEKRYDWIDIERAEMGFPESRFSALIYTKQSETIRLRDGDEIDISLKDVHEMIALLQNASIPIAYHLLDPYVASSQKIYNDINDILKSHVESF